MQVEASLANRALGASVAAGLLERDEASSAYRRSGHGDAEGVAIRLDAASKAAGSEKNRSSAAATPRRDMVPPLAARLGIDTRRSLTAAEVANLLNGQRADRKPIEGKQLQASTEAVEEIFGLRHRARVTGRLDDYVVVMRQRFRERRKVVPRHANPAKALHYAVIQHHRFRKYTRWISSPTILIGRPPVACCPTYGSRRATRRLRIRAPSASGRTAGAAK